MIADLLCQEPETRPFDSSAGASSAESPLSSPPPSPPLPDPEGMSLSIITMIATF
jgi:hypothetical protein